MWIVTVLTNTSVAATVVETPWGNMSEQRAHQLCGSAHVFIGTITNTHSFTATDGFYAGHTNSTVRWDVERNIRNTPSPFVMQQPGGKIGDQIQLLEGYPVPIPGRRYLMVVDLWPKDVPPAHKGDLWYKFSMELDPTAPLPDVIQLRTALSTVCGSLQ